MNTKYKINLDRMACTTMVVGKAATTDGSVIIAHSDDDVSDERVIFVPAADWDLSNPNEKIRPVYYDNASLGPYQDYNSTEIRRYIGNSRGPGYQTQDEGYAESIPIGYIPQVEHTYAYFDSSYGIMNEQNLMIGECTCGAKCQPWPDPKKRLMYASELSRIALERCTTAREAIILISTLIQNYGLYGTGETLLLGDANEGWVMEMAPYELDGNDGVWVAQRVKDDQYFVAANEFRIRDIKEGPTTENYGISSFDDNEVWYSLNLFDVAKAKKWPIQNNTIDWLPCVSDGEYSHPYYSLRRVWRAFAKAAPSIPLPSKLENGYSRAYPFSLVPDKKLSVLDVVNIYRDHYEGTAFDLTKGYAAEPWGNPVRYEPNPDHSDPNSNAFNLGAAEIKGAWERPLSIYRCGMMWINQAFFKDNTTVGFSWIGLDRPVATCLMPFYTQMQDLPAKLQTMNLLDFQFDGDSAWWAFNFVANWVNINYSHMMEDLKQVQQKLEMDAYTIIKDILNLKRTGNLSKVCEQNAETVISAWWQLAKKLVSKYNDGCITTGPNETMVKIEYPEDWLKKAGYYDGPINY
jgi:dipeptidase